MRPQKWEPQVGHQLQVVKYTREPLGARRLGKFTKKENAKEEWEEPGEDDVSEQVWSEIRDAGFGGRNVKQRDLNRIWSRRAKLAEQVELLELGKAGGCYHKRKRTSGAMRQACIGVGQRRAVAEAPAAQEGGAEEE